MSNLSLDRRSFLAASAVAPLALEARLARVGPNEQVTLGMIGFGIRLRNMLRGFLKDPRCRIVAVCDVVEARRNDAKSRVDKAYGNTDCKTYVEYREILARDDIDAVVIGTPDHWHSTQVVHAAIAGKDIYCEKPLTHTLREGKVIMDAVRKHGVVFQTGSQQRSEFGHKFVRAAEYVRNGRIGKVLSVHVGVGHPSRACDLKTEDIPDGTDWERWLGPAVQRGYNKILCPEGLHRHYPKWRDYWDFAGGGVADMGAHHFDIAQWAMKMDGSGPVAALPPNEKGARRGARVVYENGIEVFHGGPSGATFIGTRGMIHVDRGRISSQPGNIFKKKLGEKDERLPRNKSHISNWLDCIASRETPICSAEIGARSAAVCHLLNLAYRHGRKITWDPSAWRFASDEKPEWMDYERREGYELPTV